MTEHVSWPAPPREPGSWVPGPPVGPVSSNGARAAAPVLTVPSSAGAPGEPALGHAGWTNTSPPPPPMPGPGGNPDDRADRAPLWVLVLSVAVLAAVAIGGAYLVLSGSEDHPDNWDDRVEPLAAWVADTRGLEFDHPVFVNFLTEAEYTSASATAEPTTAEADEVLDDTVAQMRALGLVSGEVDLTESVNTLNDSGTLAFYQPSNRQIYVRGTTLTPAMRVTLVHELVHVLQDQNFDLGRSGDDEADPHGTLRAVAEGDAGRIEDLYIAEQLTDDERAAYEADSAAAGGEASDLITGSVPDGLTAVFTAPYLFGEPFVAYLGEVGGNSDIDRALQEPPSTRVLFDPLLWGTEAEADAEVEVVVPPGVDEVDSGRLGSPTLYLVLSARTTPQAALAAVDGVAGEEYVSFRDGSRVCVRTTLVGTDDAQAAELETALQGWVAQSPAETASVSRDVNDAIQFQACDPGEAAAAAAVTLDSLSLPVARTSLYLELRRSGGTEAQSSCVTAAVIPTLTTEELTVQSDAVTASLQQKVLGAMEGCRGAS